MTSFIHSFRSKNAIPLYLKVVYSTWMLVWVPSYAYFYGFSHFFWLCNAGNIIVFFGIWLESSLLLSSQIVLVLLIDSIWMLDLVVALLFNFHLVGATKYMFYEGIPIYIRLLSSFHIFMVPLLIYSLKQIGYNNIGWKLETIVSSIAIPMGYFFTKPEENVNWVQRPFEQAQNWMPTEYFVLVCILAYPILLFLPTHGLIKTWLYFYRKK